MRFRHGPHCGCPRCVVVHPTKCNVVHTCSQETCQHIHPSHTTVVNHHLIQNEHVFPHSTSYENTVNSVDVYGGSFEVPPGPGVAGPGLAGPGAFPGGPGMAPGVPGGVGPGMAPGMAPGMGMGPMGPMGPTF